MAWEFYENSMTAYSGKVVTVDGPIEPGDLGKTLTHEHIFIDLTVALEDMPSSTYKQKLAREPVNMDNLWYVRRNPRYNIDNSRLESFEEAVDEIELFRMGGGGTIVDVTPKAVGSDPIMVQKVSRATGIQMVHGTAYYILSAHPERLEDQGEDEIKEEFIDDVLNGIGDTDVPAGIIGEIGISGEIHNQEEKVLRAAARAAAETGAPLSVHPTGRHQHRDYTYPSSRWALDILDIVEEVGLPSDRVVISHMDRTPFELEDDSLDYQMEVAERGAYIEYDLWGTEISYRDYMGIGWPSDIQRMGAIKHLIEEGYTSKLLFSHDICLKIQRRKYGGFGYSHILDNVVPMLRENGVSSDNIDRILVENPKEILEFTG